MCALGCPQTADPSCARTSNRHLKPHRGETHLLKKSAIIVAKGLTWMGAKTKEELIKINHTCLLFAGFNE